MVEGSRLGKPDIMTRTLYVRLLVSVKVLRYTGGSQWRMHSTGAHRMALVVCSKNARGPHLSHFTPGGIHSRTASLAKLPQSVPVELATGHVEYLQNLCSKKLNSPKKYGSKIVCF